MRFAYSVHHHHYRVFEQGLVQGSQRLGEVPHAGRGVCLILCDGGLRTCQLGDGGGIGRDGDDARLLYVRHARGILHLRPHCHEHQARLGLPGGRDGLLGNTAHTVLVELLERVCSQNMLLDEIA